MTRRLVCGALLTALAIACSSSPSADGRACTPNVEVFCRCADRSQGTKVCSGDGRSFAECLPCDGTRPSASERDPLGNPLENGEERAEEEEVRRLDAGGPRPRRDGGIVVDAGGGTTNPGQGVGVIDAGPAPEAAHCKPLENLAPKVNLQRVADEATPAEGGRPSNGTYVQSWVVEFTGEGGVTAESIHASQQTIEISGNVGRYVLDDTQVGHQAGGFRLATADNKITFAYECPAAEPKEYAYDSKGPMLVIYDPPVARIFYRTRTGQ